MSGARFALGVAARACIALLGLLTSCPTCYPSDHMLGTCASSASLRVRPSDVGEAHVTARLGSREATRRLHVEAGRAR